ncbi:RND family efflux transporter, MFP subunit [Pseudarcicella hirudinis]|uniref:RND family efflux transporter, MFP subunit n=2 Tax=Pseudarcicella hirudinis TaxID=1079859 RepID=A0A1I5QGK7_9BACT|nr:efflux RND transporter periplasmic adaptor subunit [Pseudarcicella hirudinis]SFP45444.1 RND family efflux transporter, MFP subunit [Pseudarcicella hirudinis]
MKNKFLHSFILIALSLSACNKAEKKTEVTDNSISVNIRQVRKISVNHDISVSGNIEGSKTVRLGFMVAGKVNFISANEGQTVSQGKLLASLDPENYKIAKEMADASLNQVQDDYNRINTMHERGSVTESDYAKITNGLAQAKAQNKLQAKNITDTRLYTPISGVLLKKMTEVGEIIGVGMPLFVVSDISTVKVNAAIPESELRYIKIGQNANVYVSALDNTFSGKIIEVGSTADATSRTFTVKIELKNPKLLIRPGMIAEVKITSGTKSEVLALPGEAVLHDVDNLTYVFVADESGKKAFKRKIVTGRLLDNQIEITSGITENDKVIVGGQQKLNDGSPILINN